MCKQLCEGNYPSTHIHYLHKIHTDFKGPEVFNKR